MNAHKRLLERVSVEQDDVLATMQLVRGEADLESHLFDQLVDLLVEGMFLELRQQYLDGSLDRGEYVDELGTLAAMCRRAGLLPLPGRDV